MKLTSAAQMREIDRYVIEDLGVDGAELMQKAAEHIAAATMERLPMDGRAAVFCGTGNNGGDGIGAAAFLIEKGVTVRAILVGDENKLTAHSLVMLERLTAAGGQLEKFVPTDELEYALSKTDVIIDALFGIGLNAQLRGAALEAVNMINASPAFKISADIPSGVHADTGAVLGGAVSADSTVTFSLPKPGHFIEPGGTFCGKLVIRDIGIPFDLLRDAASDVYAVMPGELTLPRRRADTHKGDYGRCLIIAGSVGFTGAPALSAKAATRTGAGLVYLGVPETIYNIEAVKCTEEMPFPLACDDKGRIASFAFDEISEGIKQCTACLIGPGLGRSEDITQLVESVIQTSNKPLILDADGINAIAGNIDILDKASCPVILTPHPGEFARLNISPSGEDRINSARRFAQRHGCILVLKGHRTVTAMPDGTAYINTTGGPAMAKGGTGDVLAGMITSFIAQSFPMKDAVLAAVYIHGLSGDLCAEKYGEYSVTASDIIEMLPKAFKKIMTKEQ